MSYKSPNIPLIVAPVGVDKAIQDIQVALASGLSWLDRSFGRASTGANLIDGRKFYYPEVYDANGEYLDVSPNDNIKSQSFWILRDPQEIETFVPFDSNRSFKFNVSLVFWYNLDEVKRAASYTYAHRFTEELKKQILDVIKTQSNFIPEKMFETVEEIYKGYSLDHVAMQTLKHPYAGLRIDGSLNFGEC